MAKIIKVVLLIIVVGAIGLFIYGGMLSRPVASQPKLIGALYLRQHLDAYGGLKKEMEKLGYTGKNVAYDEVEIIPGPNFYADVENGAKKLIADKVDVLWVSMEHQAKTALDLTKKDNSNLPIVFMTRFHDPLSYGLIKSYKTSENNSTGVATGPVDTIQKNLQFFKEINPKATKIGVFGKGFMVPGFGDVYLSELKSQAPKFGMSVVEYTNSSAPDPTIKTWQATADKIKLGDIDGLFHIAGHFYDPQEVVETLLAKRLHIPHAAPAEDLPTGGSFAYSDDFAASAAQSAVIIDKIFKGTQPKDIPIEFGSKSLLILNLKRAAEAGFAFPNSMLNIAEIKIDK